MNTLKLTSHEALDTAVAAIVRLKIQHTAKTAEMEAEIAAVQKRHAARLTTLAQEITDAEAEVLDYCAAHRAALFPDKKSRETASATFGFELTPWRVETSSKKVKWKDVIARLLCIPAPEYLRTPTPALDKEALLSDRERLTPEQCDRFGIAFARDEQFYLRPKSESAAPTTSPA